MEATVTIGSLRPAFYQQTQRSLQRITPEGSVAFQKTGASIGSFSHHSCPSSGSHTCKLGVFAQLRSQTSLPKLAPHRAYMPERRVASNAAKPKQASPEANRYDELGASDSGESWGTVSRPVTSILAAVLVVLSSPGIGVAETSQTANQQREELISSINFSAAESTAKKSFPGASTSPVSAPTLKAGKEVQVPIAVNNSYNELVYGKLSKLHNDEETHRAMFTEDAWEGMNIVREYGRLVETREADEEACPECLQNRKLVERAWQVVSNEFYDPVHGFSQAKWAQALYSNMAKAGGLLRTKAQTYAVLSDMVASLGDHYSAFLPPSLYRLAIRHPNPSEIRYLAAQYTGIGIELGPPSSYGGFRIVAPFASSPAEEAGIQPGESLLAIDGLPCEQLTKDEAVTLMRGPVGSQVQLDVSSLQGQERQVTIERRTLPRPPLKHFNISGPAGQLFSYIRLHYFSSDGTRMVQAAIKEGETLGVDGYILDLRNNPGGVFEEAVACAALWLDCGDCQVVTTVNTNAGDDVIYQADNLSKNIFPAHPGNLTRAPLVVLANRGSASASEVLTGALQDNRRAVYIGERSFGKGVIQYYFPLTDGSGLKLTVAKYLTPSKYDIAASGGLVPDLECHDYPHGKATDDCIQLAMRTVSGSVEERR